MGDSTDAPVWNQPDVVDYYHKLSGLPGFERHTFDTYIRPGTSILDIGVGGGRTTPYLSAIAGYYVGIDYAEEMVNLCRQKFPHLEFLHLDASDMSRFADSTFDTVVFSLNGIDYLYPSEIRLRCLKECSRILKSGGILIFSVHNAKSIIVKPVSEGATRAKYLWRMFRSVFKTAQLTTRSVFKAFFWRGEGYVFDPVHGGVWTHTSTPEFVVAELASLGFENIGIVGGHHPQRTINLATPWYYYAFKKI